LQPSPLLRECPGLVLVDLPSEMDANDSRSEVARKFYGKVDRLMVVTPSDRAFDNKTQRALIFNYTTTHPRMGGVFGNTAEGCLP
jgi:hypothetical protein